MQGPRHDQLARGDGSMMLIRYRRIAVSRRGAFLALFGVVFILIGYSYLNIPASSKPFLQAYLRTALSIAPIEVYGWLWIVAGSVALLGGIIRRLDWLGFGAAVMLPLLWVAIYFDAQWQDKSPRAWVSALVYLALAGAIALVAGMSDPLHKRSRL